MFVNNLFNAGEEQQGRFLASMRYAATKYAQDTVAEMLAEDPELTGAQVLERLSAAAAEAMAETQESKDEPSQ